MFTELKGTPATHDPLQAIELADRELAALPVKPLAEIDIEGDTLDNLQAQKRARDVLRFKLAAEMRIINAETNKRETAMNLERAAAAPPGLNQTLIGKAN